MKTPLLLMLCVAPLPFLLSAQTTSPAGITSPTPSRESEIEKSPDSEISMRLERQRSPAESSSSVLDTWSAASEKPTQPTVPRVSIGPFPVSGFFVDAFRSAPLDGEKRHWSERILGGKIQWSGSLLTPRTEAPVKYFKWGERDKPWSVSSQPTRREPESDLFSLRF